MAAVAVELGGGAVEELDQVDAGRRAGAATRQPRPALGPHQRRQPGRVEDAVGDDAEHAEGALGAAGEDHALAAPHLRLDLAFECAHLALFDLAPFDVERVELGGERAGARRVGAAEQLEREFGPSHAAGGIEAWRQPEGDVLGARRAAHPRDADQLAQTGEAAAAERAQAFGDECAIRADERHHVGDGRDRDQAEGVDQEAAPILGQRGGGTAPQQAPGQQVGHRRAAEVGEAAVRRAQPRVQQRGAGRPHRAGRVVIDDHDLDPALAEPADRIDRGGAVVDRDDQAGAAASHRLERAFREGVAVLDAVRQEDLGRVAEQPQKPPEQRAAGDAVDVVIAVDQDRAAGGEGALEGGGGGLELGQTLRLGHAGQARTQERAGLLGVARTAVDEHLGGQRLELQQAAQALARPRVVALQVPAVERNQPGGRHGAILGNRRAGFSPRESRRRRVEKERPLPRGRGLGRQNAKQSQPMVVATPFEKVSEPRSKAWSHTAMPVVPGGTGAAIEALPAPSAVRNGSSV